MKIKLILFILMLSIINLTLTKSKVETKLEKLEERVAALEKKLSSESKTDIKRKKTCTKECNCGPNCQCSPCKCGHK